MLEERGDAVPGNRVRLESFQHVEVDRIVDDGARRALAVEIERNLRDVRAACADWAAMRAAARKAAHELVGEDGAPRPR